MPIDGLASNLDTSSLIAQLMEVERAPQTLLSQRRVGVQAIADAYASIRSRLSALDAAANALRRPADWQARTATSSSDAVAVSASSGASLGSLTFEVSALAARHSLRSGNVIGAITDVVASGGTVQITDSSGVHDLDVGGGTLTEVVNALNDAGIGLQAAAVDTGSGYRLQITSASTGAASAFTVSAGLDVGVGGMVVSSTGTDAVLTVGSGGGAYTVTSASNTLSDVLPGLTITLRSLTSGPVTVEVVDDVDTLVKRVQAMVDAANAVRNEVATRTAYDADSRKAASLAGDSTARRIAQEMTWALGDAVGSSSLGSAGLAGISVDRYGNFDFDQAAFRAAYADDPLAVEHLFAQTASATGSVRFLAAGDRTVAGSYDVEVTAAATAATTTGLTGTWPLGSPTTLTLRSGGLEASYTTQPTDSTTDAAAGLQAAIDAAGMYLTATVDGTGLRITHANVGAAASFEVAWDGVTFTQHAGTDVAGTIDGVAATGVGSTLTVPPGADAAAGLSVEVLGSGTGIIGSIDYDRGVAQRLASVLDRTLDPADGYLTTKEAGANSRVADLDASIAAYEIRLEAREKRLRTQYAQLEVALSNLQNQGNWLAGQLAGLPSSGSEG
jgi:flagellar hook-associated protein 2